MLRAWDSRARSVKLQVDVLSDWSAACGDVSRRGLGKAKHIQSRFLWLQERVAEGHLAVKAIKVKHNSADMLTKSLSGTEITRNMRSLGFEFSSGRSDLQKSL